MLLQRLREYAERQLHLPPPMYQEQPIRYLFDLDRNGRMHGPPIDTADPANKATKSGSRFLAPHVKRTVAVRAKLLADTSLYALGMETPDTKPDRVRHQHDAFQILVDDCARLTGEPSVSAVAAFLADLDLGSLPLPSDFDAAAHMTFRVEGVLPIELPSVREYWASVQGAADAGDEGDGASGERLQCIVCGQMQPVLQRHPLKIKGIPGGQIGKDLISANAGAFESYGLSNSLIAPTCQTCAEAYGNALNSLLVDPDTHVRVGGVAYAFWAVAKTGFRPGKMLSQPDPAEVRELIDAQRTARSGATRLDPTAFYAVSLGPSGARVVVRDWMDTTVGEAQQRLATFFERQELVDAYGARGDPLPVWRLANATVRDARKEAPPATVPSALFANALGGRPLPLDLLFQAVRRNRAEQDVTRERAALIKLVGLSRREAGMGGIDVSTQLDLRNTEPAYLCGRLLAVLDAIQQRALNSPNATIVDKYYGTASSAPASVFGTLLHGAQPHLGKLRKDPRTHSAHAALERRLEEVMAGLDGFPATLTLQEQGLFALGFYHQRAEDRRARRERAAGAADVTALDQRAEALGTTDPIDERSTE
ncbi:MAG: type I-C CRISPR-associated protein Cas8c/Csd1 [Chloroflexota bacterium]|nr:type I-C CRISPR-associated protein Cas8c/Csd1 [Chloroflexota bacterium]